MFKEETICKLQQGKTKLHLLKLTTNNNDSVVEEITNTVGGYLIKWSDGRTTPIQDKQVEEFARIWNLKKDNENYYYRQNAFAGEVEYQVRLNRKRIKTRKSEYEMRKLFANLAINIVTQLKLSL